MPRTILIALVCLACARPAPAAGVARLFEELRSAPGLKNAAWTASVVDCASGKTVFESEPRRNMVPASALKVFVTAAALDILGPGYRAETRLLYSGKLQGGELDGTLYIQGGGDPSLGSGLVRGAAPLEAAMDSWAAAVKAAGIASVSGGVAADESLFDGDQPGSWAWEDIGNYYAARASALSVGDNLYRIIFRPGVAPGEPAELLRTEPEMPGLSFDNRVLTGPKGSGDNAYVYAFPGASSAVLKGTVPQGPPEFAIKAALPDPALHLARAFAARLTAEGVKTGGAPRKAAAPAGARHLSSATGAPLLEVVRVTNKKSYNLYAELLLRRLGVSGGGPGTAEGGVSALRTWLAAQGADVSELKLADASGLSRANLVKAENFTSMLCSVSKKPFYGEFRDSLLYPSDPDATGHARRLGAGTPLETRLRLKSGSLAGVRAYTGYLETGKGRTLAFAFILNDYSSSPSGLDGLHERLLLKLAGDY